MSGLTGKDLHICCWTRLPNGDSAATGALSNCASIASIEVHSVQFFGVVFLRPPSRNECARVLIHFLLLFVWKRWPGAQGSHGTRISMMRTGTVSERSLGPIADTMA
jgi:hypothetical protein